jgi:transposase
MGHVATLFKCMCKTGGRYLPAFALWRPLGERLQQCASHFTIEERVQQRVCTDFCFRLGKTGAETHEMLQAAFGETCRSRSKTFEWHSLFKSGRRSSEDDPRPGRPSTSHTETVARVREIIRADRRLTIREVAEEVTIAFGSARKFELKICE